MRNIFFPFFFFAVSTVEVVFFSHRLLEKQNNSSSSSTGRRKRRSNLTLLSINSSSKNDDKNHLNLSKMFPPQSKNSSTMDKNSESVPREYELIKNEPNFEENVKYGMTVSLRGGLRKVVLLPVNVQVSLKDTDMRKEW